MKKNELRILIFSAAFPLYLFLLSFLSRQLLAQLSFSSISEKGLLSSVSYDNRNSTYSYLLGRFYQYDIERPDLKTSILYFQKSLRASPLQGGCWLDLAHAYQTSGMTENAGKALKRAVMLNSENPGVIWEAGVFYLINGDIAESVRNFRKFILLKPERQDDVYDMIWKLPVDSSYVLKNLIPDSYPFYRKYLLYLMSTDRIPALKELWEAMKGKTVEDELLLNYEDFLISKHLYDDAESIWKDFTFKKFKVKADDRQNLLWNGDFELQVVNGGFDWRVSETPGVDVFLDRDIHILGKKSIGVTFDGTQNPDALIASQVVRVKPDAKYLLRGNIKTENITTTNGLYFAVYGHDCKEFYKKSDVITGTNFWREIALEFKVPTGCGAITVMVKRDRSNKFNNKISGNAWIDGISLNQR
jgi:tetratricopeptide (TPR) repeat protein